MAQNIIKCQFCDASKNVKWKCVDCSLHLCDECKTKKHSKFKGSEDHVIFQLNQLGTSVVTDAMRMLDLKNIQCSFHDEKCSLYCDDCNRPVCSLCVLETHQQHQLVKIDEAFNQQLEKLKDLKEKIENDLLPFYCENIKVMNMILNKGLDTYEEQKQKILHKEKGARDKATLEAIIEHDKRWTPKNESVLTELQRLHMAEMDLKLRQSEINNAIQLRQATSVFQTFLRVQKNLPIKSEIPRHLFTFPSEKTPDSESTVKTPELKIVKTYKHASHFIFHLNVLKNGTFVIDDSENIKYLAVDNSELKQIGSIDITEEMQPGWNDMTVTDDGTVYLSHCREYDVMCVKKGTKLKRFVTIEPNEPEGLYAKDNETILVGFVSGVIIFNLQGRQLQKFEMDTFLCPEKLTTNLNGDICIIDRSSGDPDCMYGKIVVHGSKGELKWTYSGHGDENSSDDEFSPFCIVTTEKGNILTSESNTIHMLSKDGKFIKSFGEKQGIPHSDIVQVNNNGQLILVESGEICKIHVLDLINI